MSAQTIALIVTIVGGFGTTILAGLGWAGKQAISSMLGRFDASNEALLVSLKETREANTALVETMVGMGIDVAELRRLREVELRMLTDIHTHLIGAERPSDYGQEIATISLDAERQRRERMERKDNTLRIRRRRATGGAEE